MSVALICPNCQVATTFHRGPISACPNCQSAFPPALKDPAETTLARQEAPQPILITIGRFVAPGFGGLWLLGLFGTLLTGGRFTIDGEVVSPGEFMARAGLAWVLIGGACIAIGVAIWHERSWSRPLMVGFWLVLSALTIGLSVQQGVWTVIQNTIWCVLLVGASSWYLYAKENVVRYYKALEMRGRVGIARAPDDL